jgi:hypothetical protein
VRHGSRSWRRFIVSEAIEDTVVLITGGGTGLDDINEIVVRLTAEEFGPRADSTTVESVGAERRAR